MPRPYLHFPLHPLCMNRQLHQPQRRSIRWRGYDYSQNGAYFVSISVQRRVRRKDVFGRIESGVMKLNVYGRIVETCWLSLPEHFPDVILDEWVVMPNHFHGIVMIARDAENAIVRARHASPVPSPLTAHAPTLGTIIGAFKSAVTRRINIYRAERNLPPVEVWHRNYFERVIRNESELDDTRCYLAQNPLNWETDEHHPAVIH